MPTSAGKPEVKSPLVCFLQLLQLQIISNVSCYSPWHPHAVVFTSDNTEHFKTHSSSYEGSLCDRNGGNLGIQKAEQDRQNTLQEIIFTWAIQQHTCKQINKQDNWTLLLPQRKSLDSEIEVKVRKPRCTRWSGKIPLWRLSRGENGS